MSPLAVSTAVWIFILIPLLVVWAIGLVDIFRRDLPGGTRAAWVLIVVLLPLVGTIAYFVLRKPTAEEVQNAQRRHEMHLEGWESDKGSGRGRLG